jgi:tRNA pseudouridine55 synthase
MAAVATVRRRAGGTKTGHAGTLDPLADGVLLMAVGKATRIAERLMKTDKRYLSTIDLTAFTTTDDTEGEREEVPVETPPSLDAVREAVAAFEGVTQQRPPAFSAIKVDGRRAYKLARKGRPPELPPREVQVHGITLKSYEWPTAVVAIHCAKGFYVRSLARDLGTALGTGGHCLSITRTAVGPFTLEQSIKLDDVPDPVTQDDLIDVDSALAMI